MDDNLVDKIKGLLAEIRGALRNEDPQGWEREREAVRAAHESLRTKHEEAIREQREIIDKAEAALDDLAQHLAEAEQPAPAGDLNEASERKDAPAIGDQRTDNHGDVWERRPDGTWRAWMSRRNGWSMMAHSDLDTTLDALDKCWGPFRPTTDEDRKRVGLPVQDEAGERRVNVTITDVYAAPADHGFLRINVGPETAVIDQNASNVTVTDVDPAPAGDPDEVLAEALRKAHTTGDWLDVARAAREHFHANEGYEYDLLMRDRNMRPSQRGEG